MYNEIYGDLIQLALSGSFDVIAHGCNCFCTQASGIAPQMAFHFGTNQASGLFELEHKKYIGDFNKLGNIESHLINIGGEKSVYVVNAYTQYNYGRQPGGDLDYEALTMCMRKINFDFDGRHIGLPKIGAGLAGGSWDRIKEIIQREFKDCDVTVVIYKP